MIKIGVVGCGYWGPNYIRAFNESANSKVQSCCDLKKENLAKIKNIYSDIEMTNDYQKIINNHQIDAVVITTPPNSHYEIAKACLENKKHVLVEKPFTSNSKEAAELIKIGKKNKLTLMVGHVYKYNPGIVKLKEIIKNNDLGTLYYINAERIGLGPIRRHANALWDLATHDISIALYLLDDFPVQITVAGGSYIQNDVEDAVFVNLKFSSKLICNIHANWIAPEKIRKVTVVGSKGMAVFNDTDKTEALKIYEREIDKSLMSSTPEYSDHLSIVRIGNIYIPKLEQSEPLKNQVKHFLECIQKNKNPLTDGKDGLDVVRILEMADKSLKIGKTVKCR